ncbi:MAG: hypothetical protein CM15mP21_6790 [Hyphomicrobiales bacterium]|nr:MAG: hypothetical protein CM15mP21_6790 [Hyphomicrobiales bacterium]
MTRSVWKGPFVDGYLLKRRRPCATVAAPMKSSRSGAVVRQFCRNLSALTFGVHNGQKHIPVSVTEDMVAINSANLRPRALLRPCRGQEGEKEVIMENHRHNGNCPTMKPRRSVA